MNLFTTTLLNGVGLLALGGLLLWNGAPVEKALKAFPRSLPATWVLFGAALAWFLYHVANLGEADYGNYRMQLFAGFLAVGLLCFYWVPDFLAVRGLAGLMLLGAKENLDAAYMQWDHPQRLVLVGFTYLGICLALYLSVSPFRVRDAFEWLFARADRPRAAGAVAAALGLLLAGVAISY